MSNTKRNQWGSESFADLISMAIQSAPEQKITLQNIYKFLIDEKAYFRRRQDRKSAAGWQNSVRHNLSLHKQFVLDKSTRPGLWSLDESRHEEPAKRRGRPRNTSASTPSPRNCSPDSSDASRMGFDDETASVPDVGYVPNGNFEPFRSVQVGNFNAGYYEGPPLDFYAASFVESPAALLPALWPQEIHEVPLTDYNAQEQPKTYFNL